MGGVADVTIRLDGSSTYSGTLSTVAVESSGGTSCDSSKTLTCNLSPLLTCSGTTGFTISYSWIGYNTNLVGTHLAILTWETTVDTHEPVVLPAVGASDYTV